MGLTPRLKFVVWNNRMPLSSLLLLGVTAGASTRGVAIAIAGMLIVATVLVAISLFIAVLPKVLAEVAKVFPEQEHPHSGKSHPESLIPDNEAVIAAVGYVLHLRAQGKLPPSQS
jgi:hypothetical protein